MVGVAGWFSPEGAPPTETLMSRSSKLATGAIPGLALIDGHHVCMFPPSWLLSINYMSCSLFMYIDDDPIPKKADSVELLEAWQ